MAYDGRSISLVEHRAQTFLTCQRLIIRWSRLHARKNMTHAAFPRSEAFHSRLEVQARARNERQRGKVGLHVRHLSLSYLSERCVRVDSFQTIIHLHVHGKDEVQ
ncbi:jg10574 [Pararge aegeria aegeria]|uniref:Jg10574 protein n=1 Tax=Pararge aegeria aegeria TaxID=348720 RepID=A0A8S4RC20_9NEOP|nr:jg10574 [Pararge aegeria aegeria]